MNFDNYLIHKRQLTFDIYNGYHIIRFLMVRLDGVDKPKYFASTIADPQLILDKEFRQCLYQDMNKYLNYSH